MRRVCDEGLCYGVEWVVSVMKDCVMVLSASCLMKDCIMVLSASCL